MDQLHEIIWRITSPYIYSIKRSLEYTNILSAGVLNYLMCGHVSHISRGYGISIIRSGYLESHHEST